MLQIKRFLITIGFIVTLLGTPVAVAGAMSSTGGELLRDTTNPWLLGNVERVKACIVVDREHFSLPDGDPSVAKAIIEKSLAYWTAQFTADVSGVPAARIGTQTFVFGDCEAETDLRFQLGVLTREQRHYLQQQGQDPRHLVSLAVRTDYDRVHMRGRGFIYVAPDSGELSPDPSDMAQLPWARGGAALLRVLTHELGHVFGIQHTGNTQADFELMADDYPETVVDPARFTPFDWAKVNLPSFFADPHLADGYFPEERTRVGMSFTPEALAYLGSGSDSQCFGERRVANDALILRGCKNAATFDFGRIHLTGPRLHSMVQTPIRLFLPWEQQVFRPGDILDPSGKQRLGGFAVHIGPCRSTAWTQAGIYQSTDGKTQHKVVVNGVRAQVVAKIAGFDDEGRSVLMDLEHGVVILDHAAAGGSSITAGRIRTIDAEATEFSDHVRMEPQGSFTVTADRSTRRGKSMDYAGHVTIKIDKTIITTEAVEQTVDNVLLMDRAVVRRLQTAVH